MKRILAWILSLIMLFTALSGCYCTQTNTKNLDTSPRNDIPSTGSETTPTAPLQNDDDPQGTSPEATTPHENAEEPPFQYDPYRVTADARAYYSEEDYAFYCKMIDSVLSHNGVIEGFESEEQFFRIWRFFLEQFVPARSIVQSYLSSDEPYTYESGTATLKFVGDKATCDENYRAFENIMNEALSLIKEDDSDWERIAKLYLYVSDHMSYGSPYDTYGVQADLYNCIIYKLGQCGAFSFYLNMLVNQIGFETIDGASMEKNGLEGADHSWSMICVDGQWYHFDACWESPSLTLQYFAFNTEDRYYSLARNNFGGKLGEVEMFNQNDYTNERTELPYCESGISEDERAQIYNSVIEEYLKSFSNAIPENAA